MLKIRQIAPSEATGYGRARLYYPGTYGIFDKGRQVGTIMGTYARFGQPQTWTVFSFDSNGKPVPQQEFPRLGDARSWARSNPDLFYGARQLELTW